MARCRASCTISARLAIGCLVFSSRFRPFIVGMATDAITAMIVSETTISTSVNALPCGLAGSPLFLSWVMAMGFSGLILPGYFPVSNVIRALHSILSKGINIVVLSAAFGGIDVPQLVIPRVFGNLLQKLCPLARDGFHRRHLD